MAAQLKIMNPLSEVEEQVLNPKTVALIESLHDNFENQRRKLLEDREILQKELDDGKFPNFLTQTKDIRESNYVVSPIPEDLQDRRVEITGPPDRKMVINALNSPVKTFMCDFEDSCSPTWKNIIQGHVNVRDAVEESIEFTRESDSKVYRLNDEIATLIIRPRGWHLNEKHLTINDQPISASLFDFAVYLSNNYEALSKKGTGPYFYLPKLENHLEARLWNDVFVHAQNFLNIDRGTIKATVLIETITAAFEMDEIIFELKEHSAGLNCGRWDYIFSFIKKFRNHQNFLLPNRTEVTMERHFLKSYVDLLIRTCHKRNVHAMGGMAAQIPIRGDEEQNQNAMNKVSLDKLREANAGHDGTWIAHPGLSQVAMSAFNQAMGSSPNQITNKRNDVSVNARDLIKVPQGNITEEGLRQNISIGIQYIEAWLSGNGCVPIHNLMEDAATAEISRSQIWQWIHHRAKTTDSNKTITEEYFIKTLEDEMDQLKTARGSEGDYLQPAINLFKEMSTDSEFDEFLTLPAYKHL